MKALLLSLAAVAALAGCASYGDPYGYGSATVQYQTGPGYSYGYPSTYPGAYGAYGTYPGYPAGTVRRDRDADGIPNRVDHDRDGDGVPNQYDRRPNNPNRR